MYEIADSAELARVVTYHISWRRAIHFNAHHLCNSVKGSVPQAIERRAARYEQCYPQKLGNHHHSTRAHRYGTKQRIAKFRFPTHQHPSNVLPAGASRIGMGPGLVYPVEICATSGVA